MDKEKIKSEIKKSYGEIAKGNIQVGCCSTDNGCCSTDEFSTCMAEDYSEIIGYQKDADLSLSCGLPTEIANIKEGDTVIDLGSGAGNDAFIARSIVGESGKVIGIDMTQEMVIRALQNNQKLGYRNVEFVLGEIENMQSIQSSIADVIISNCVMNFVLDKEKAFKEIFRVMKPGGHFSISDIVYSGSIPVGVLNASEMHVGCLSGASEKDEYLRIIEKEGFRNIQIKKERKIELPDDLLLKYMNNQNLIDYKNSSSGIYSVTIYADKLEGRNCSDSSGGCCCNGATNTSKEETKNRLNVGE